MTPKQRFESAMRFRQPDDMVSYMEVEFQLYEELVGEDPVVGFEFAKMTAREKERALCRNAEIIVQTAEKAGQDVVQPFGGYWEVAPGKPALLWLPDRESQLDMLKALKKAAGEKYFILAKAGPTMCIPDGEHIYSFVEDMYDRPDEMKQELENRLQHSIEWQKKLLEAGADGIMNPADIAFNSGPFISPAKCDEFFFPYFNRWIEWLSSQNIISIWHTDGNIMPLMSRTLESGVTAIQCIDPIAGMDIVELKKQVDGKLALIGNINIANLENGTTEEIDAEVKRVVEGCKGNGGFALSACNAIFKGIPIENYRAMVEARYTYGREEKLG